MRSTGHIIIRGGTVLDPKGGRAELADLVLSGDTIAAVLSPGEQGPESATILEASGMIVMPGLVNGHTHGHGCLAKGLVEDHWTLELFLNSGPALSGNRTLEEKALAARIGAVEMIRKGCTACFDVYFEFPVPTVEGMQAVADAYRDVGIRVVLAPMVADRNLYEALPGLLDAIPPGLRGLTEQFMLKPHEITLEHLRAIFNAWPGDRDHVKPAVAPTIPLHCSDAFWIECGDLAEEFDLQMQTHLAETQTQAVLGEQTYGKSLTAHLRDLGILSDRFSAAHGIWLDHDDLSMLADAGSSIVHNPLSNMRVGSGIACVRPMINRGINVGIGTDASCASDSMNMYEATRLASFISRIQTPDYRQWLTGREVLSLATSGSAWALGFGDRIGRVAPGCKADLVFLDTRHINYIPLNDVTRQVAFCENGAAIHRVMVGGRTVLEAGKVLTVDENRLYQDAEAARERLRGANRDLRRITSQFEDIVGSFCLGLSRQSYTPSQLDPASRPGQT